MCIRDRTESNLKNYALGMIISYDANGKPSVNIKKSDYAKEQTVTCLLYTSRCV